MDRKKIFKRLLVRSLIIGLTMLISQVIVIAQPSPTTFQNPILSGFNPDPSICRVGEDYYMVTSSFTWFPGLPIFHSKDLVNWELIGHGIDRPGLINMQGINDNDGLWAPTIRYHKGLFYIINTANKCGGNFFITATNPQGPWSDPVWLKDASGIDPSLFWDDNGKCYYTGNWWNFEKSWSSQCAVWSQELDLTTATFIGERKILTYGHANNATFAEGPHIYKINKKYLLLMAEGGSGYHHAVTVHHSDSISGSYVSDKTNPVLTHRHLGANYPIQSPGHADLVQTQNGEWWAVVLAKRMIKGKSPLARETFLCKVDFENRTPIFNPGYGTILSEQQRPNLPWTPVKETPIRDNFDTVKLNLGWYTVRTPLRDFYQIEKGKLLLSLQPEVIDSLTNASMLIQKVKHQQFTACTKLEFQTKKENEQAGLILYRTANGYYSLLKGKTNITLVKMHLEKKIIVEQQPYNNPIVYLKVIGDGLEAVFSYGETENDMRIIGGTQNLEVISDNKVNKFNGTGVGMYATSNCKKSKQKALFDWFEYKH